VSREEMESIIKIFSSHGTLIQPDTLEYILKKDDPEEFSNRIISQLKEYPLILTLNQVKELEENLDETIDLPHAGIDEEEISKHIPSIRQITIPVEGEIGQSSIQFKEEIKDNGREIISTSTWKPVAKEYQSDIKIIKDITGKSLSEGSTEDFAKLFSDRFETLRKILRTQRREVAQVIPINRLKKVDFKEIQLIGIVNEVRTTVNGNRLIELEDDTGIVTAIALKKQSDVFQQAKLVLEDEIIGIVGQLSKQGDLFVISKIVFPDISLNNHHHTTDIPIYAAFIGDLHVGSREFMEHQWNLFIKWLKGKLGNIRQREVAGRIKYLIIPGDVVDGIGVYPNQEKDLIITDLYKQYEALADYLSMIPDYISVIIQPGNHDAVRPAEPQPTFEKEIQDLFTGNDITFIGNPCSFTIHGVEILSYHGQSMLDYATRISTLKYNEPLEIMKVMLQKHHLAPVYGGYTPLAPEHRDYMVIDRIPDIFVTGHVHLAGIGEYRGVTLINASSWQKQTGYQKMMNFIPNPAKIPIAELHTGKVTMMDFNSI